MRIEINQFTPLLTPHPPIKACVSFVDSLVSFLCFFILFGIVCGNTSIQPSTHLFAQSPHPLSIHPFINTSQATTHYLSSPISRRLLPLRLLTRSAAGQRNRRFAHQGSSLNRRYRCPSSASCHCNGRRHATCWKSSVVWRTRSPVFWWMRGRDSADWRLRRDLFWLKSLIETASGIEKLYTRALKWP